MAARGAAVVATFLLVFFVIVNGIEPGAARETTSAVQVIGPDAEHKKLEVKPEGLKWLSALQEPVSVVGMVGPYHSGKSFLLNALQGETEGFRVGASVSPETQGLWLRRSTLEASDGSTVLLLDSEGFYGSDVAEAYDAKIFAVSVLLSSHLVYNSIKVIDQAAVDYLELLARRAQLFQLKNTLDLNASSVAVPQLLKGEEFPPLTWVVKDFAQTMTRTPKEWLMDYINGRRDAKTEPGHGLDTIFPKGIYCATLFLPATSKEKLSDLSKVKTNELTPDFNSGVNELKESILGNLEAKKSVVGSMNGAAMAALLQFLVFSVNENKFPELPSLWQSWTVQLTESAVEEAMLHYKNDMEAAMQLMDVPSEIEFPNIHRKALEDALTLFKQFLFNFQHLYGPKIAKVEETLNERFKVYTEAHINRVRRVIAGHEAALATKMLTEFDSIDLPAEQKHLQSMFNQISKGIRADFKQALAKHEKSTLFTEYEKRLVEAIEAKQNSLSLQNRKLVAELLNKASGAYRKVYTSDMDLSKVAVSLKKMEQNNVLARTKAKAAFSIEVAERSWLQHEKEYFAELALAEKSADEQFMSYLTKNEERIASKCEQKAHTLLSHWDIEQRDIKPFPDDEGRLLEKANEISSKKIAIFESSMEDFKGSSSLARARENLKIRLLEETEELLQRNIKSLKGLCYGAFKCAKKSLDASTCTFCLSYFVPWAHQHAVFQAAIACFALDGEASKMSEILQGKVIQDWYDIDLAAERTAVNTKFAIFVVICVVFAASLWPMRPQNTPTAKLQMKSPAPSSTPSASPAKPNANGTGQGPADQANGKKKL